MKNLSSNSSLKIIMQKAPLPRPCSLVLCSPFHCPSGSSVVGSSSAPQWTISVSSTSPRGILCPWWAPLPLQSWACLGLSSYLSSAWPTRPTASHSPSAPRGGETHSPPGSQGSQHHPDRPSPASQTLCPREPCSFCFEWYELDSLGYSSTEQGKIKNPSVLNHKGFCKISYLLVSVGRASCKIPLKILTLHIHKSVFIHNLMISLIYKPVECHKCYRNFYLY